MARATSSRWLGKHTLWTVLGAAAQIGMLFVFKSAGLSAAGFLRQRAQSGLDFRSFALLPPYFYGAFESELLKYSLLLSAKSTCTRIIHVHLHK